MNVRIVPAGTGQVKPRALPERTPWPAAESPESTESLCSHSLREPQSQRTCLARQLPEARTLGASGTVAIDDDTAIAELAMVDAVADTVGGETAAKLFSRVKNGGSFGYASVLPEGAPKLNPTVTVTRVFARPDASKVREFADDIRDGKFLLPISRRLPLRDAGKAHALAQPGGAGKIVLVCQDT